MNLAYRDVRHNLGRFIVTCLGLSLLLGVVLAIIGIYRGLIADALELVEPMDNGMDPLHLLIGFIRAKMEFRSPL